MGFLVLGGEKMNALADAQVLAASPTPDTQFPAANAVDGFLDTPLVYGSAAANGFFRGDLNRVVDGGFETWPTGWTVVVTGSGAFSQETTLKVAGASSGNLASGTGTVEVLREPVFRAGGRLRGTVSLRATSALAGLFEVFNPVTKKYLHANGTWQTAPTYYFQTTLANTWQTQAISFTIESYATCGVALVPIRVRILNLAASTSVFVDELYLWPETNLLALLDHDGTIEPGTPVEWRSSTDNFAANDVLVATLTHRPFDMWNYQSTAVQTRYIQAKFTGTPRNPIRVGGIVAGYALSTQRGAEPWMRVQMEHRQARGRRVSIPLTGRETNLRLNLAYPTAAAYAEFDELLARCAPGAPILAIIEHANELVYGRISPIEDVDKLGMKDVAAVATTGLEITPLPRGIWIA